MKLKRTFLLSPAIFSVLPLINVLFLVLVFFVMGSRFTLQPGVQVALPATSFAIGQQRGAQLVTITGAPAPAIYHRDQKVTLETLLASLAAHTGIERSLIIKADRQAPSGLVGEVMNEALRRGWSVVLAGEIKAP